MRRPLCLLALILTAGLFVLVTISPAYEDPYLVWDGESVMLSGRVISKEYKSGTSTWSHEETLTLLITMDHVQSDGLECPSADKVLVRVPVGDRVNDTDTMARIGAVIMVSGRLAVFKTATNSGGFDASLYYRTLGMRFQVRDAQVLEASGHGSLIGNGLYAVRTHLNRILYGCCITEDDADIMSAMLLGDKGSLSQEIRDLYQSAGIIHILAISGLHIEIIGMSCYRLLGKSRVPRRLCGVIAATVMLLYGQMTGMSASSCRALIMFGLHILARSIHRTYDLLSALSVAGMLLLLEQPLYLHYSGFLFSFSAVLAIGLLTPILPADILPAGGKGLLWRGETWLRRRLRLDRRNNKMAALPGISLQGLAVTIGTFPVNLVTYGTFPLYSVPLNAMVLPLMSLVMVAGLLILAGGVIWLPIGRVAALPVHYLLHFYRLLCRIAAALPGHIQVIGHPAMGMVLAFVLLMGLLLLLADGRTGRQERRLPGVLILLWIMGCLQLLTLRSEAGLRIHVIDVGQGDGIYIECDGRHILIDGGSTDQSDVARYDLEPLLTSYGAATIDLAIMTHEDQDHMNGLLTLLASQKETGIRIRRIAMPDVAESSKGENYLLVERTAREVGTQLIYLHQGSEIQVGQLVLTCLNPAAGTESTEPNETSVTLYLVYREFTALLTGDLEGDGEKACLSYMTSRRDLFPEAADGDPLTYDQITFLKTAHHGSRGATSEAFLAMVHPQYAAISCGRNNRYGHPHEKTLERLSRIGTQVLDTRYTGEITVDTDGRRMRIRTFCNP